MKSIWLRRLVIAATIVAGTLGAGSFTQTAEARLFGRRLIPVGDVWHQGIYDPAWAGGIRVTVPPPGGVRHVEYGYGVGGTSVYRIQH
jgi:hypothetical protein